MEGASRNVMDPLAKRPRDRRVERALLADHDPMHFHVRYSGQKALIDIENLSLLRGSLSPRALALVMEWAELHHGELLEDWRLAKTESQLNPMARLG